MLIRNTTILSFLLWGMWCLPSVIAQEFTFTMTFQDAAGNRDSLVLGYAPQGTERIDEALGEENIIDKAYQEGLDVRVSDEWYLRKEFNQPGTFHTKRQFVKSDSFSIITIDIRTDHWPVTAQWDSALFANDTLEGTLFTSITPGGWWDTGSPSDLGRIFLKDTDEVTFSTNNTPGYFSKFYSHLHAETDTIPAFWFLFSDGASLPTTTPVHDPETLDDIVRIFPNPFQDEINLVIKNAAPTGIQQAALYQMDGRLVRSFGTEMNLPTRDLPAGIYILKITTTPGKVYHKKMIRE